MAESRKVRFEVHNPRQPVPTGAGRIVAVEVEVPTDDDVVAIRWAARELEDRGIRLPFAEFTRTITFPVGL